MSTLIIGAGLSGIVMANLIANKYKERVIIIDKFNHIGGSCYDEYDEINKIMVQKYGPHIFKTNDKKIWNYLSQYTDWNIYFHNVLTYVDSMYLNLPVNLNTLNDLFKDTPYQKNINDLIEYYGYDSEISIGELSKNKKFEYISKLIISKFYEQYSEKQWGGNNNTNAVNRIKIRLSKNNNYFTEKYQGIPSLGYTHMFKKMLDNDLIELRLNETYKFDINDAKKYKYIISTTSIDEMFKYKYGKLDYRSLLFKHELIPKPQYQLVSVINYPNNFDFTRITEHKHFYNNVSNNTIITKEFPIEYKEYCNERYYPINNNKNQILYNKYLSELPKNVFMLGRIGQYKYLNMDECVNECFILLTKIYE